MKKRSVWDMQMYISSFRWRRKVKRHLKDCIIEKKCSGFFIWKEFCRTEFAQNIVLCVEQKEEQQALMFDWDKIVEYRKCGLSFSDIAHYTGWHPNTVMRICYQYFVEGLTELHAGSQGSTMTNTRENRHIER